MSCSKIYDWISHGRSCIAYYTFLNQFSICNIAADFGFLDVESVHVIHAHTQKPFSVGDDYRLFNDLIVLSRYMSKSSKCGPPWLLY